MSRVRIALAAMVSTALGGIATAEETSSSPRMIDLEKGRNFWSFQPLRPPTPPDAFYGGTYN